MRQIRTAKDLPPKKKIGTKSKDVVSKVENLTYVYPFAKIKDDICHLNLNRFKTQPCRIPHVHNKIQCPYYHNRKKDYRRNPSVYKYSSFICLYVKKNKKCPYQDKCTSCHNSVELNYHPNNYKKRFCIFFPDNLKKCKFGDFCSYAHSENDILVELLHNYDFDEDFFMFHYKTSFCPINHIDHDRSLCVYAHNWQDFRRKPHKHYIQPSICPDWNNSKIVLNYQEGCPRGFDCHYCHGWKEPEYDPFVYKTKKCEYDVDSCPRLSACPYYHSEDERRHINQEDKNFFEFFPRNRVVQGIYKVFLDKHVHGLTHDNKYNESKNDKRRFDSLIMSMTSFNLQPLGEDTTKSLCNLERAKAKKLKKKMAVYSQNLISIDELPKENKRRARRVSIDSEGGSSDEEALD